MSGKNTSSRTHNPLLLVRRISFGYFLIFFHELFSNVWSSRSKNVIHYKIFSLNFVWFKNAKIDILLVWVKKSSQDLVNRFKLLSIFLSFLFPATGALNWVATRWVQNIFNSVRNQTTCFRNGSTTCFQVSERT